jgi:hypothetical protein
LTAVFSGVADATVIGKSACNVAESLVQPTDWTSRPTDRTKRRRGSAYRTDQRADTPARAGVDGLNQGERI